jgi:hypothetical protein
VGETELQTCACGGGRALERDAGEGEEPAAAAADAGDEEGHRVLPR